MSDYPEHDKLEAVQGETQTIGEFLEWADHQGIILMHISADDRPYGVSWEPLLAQWAGVDLDKLETEKQAMMKAMRDMQAGR